MRHAPRFPRTQAIALARPSPVLSEWSGWEVAAIGLALLLVGLLGV